MRIPRGLVPAVLALVLAAGASGCGGDDDPAAGPSETPQTQTTPEPTDGTSSAVPDPMGTPTGRPTPPVGLPTGFPTSKVPVLYGVVTGQSGGPSGDGPQGWVLELSTTGTAAQCFARAEAALVADGFTQQGEDLVAGDTRQAQFTSPEYAVIISARSDGDELCQLGYEVGEVSK